MFFFQFIITGKHGYKLRQYGKRCLFSILLRAKIRFVAVFRWILDSVYSLYLSISLSFLSGMIRVLIPLRTPPISKYTKT